MTIQEKVKSLIKEKIKEKYNLELGDFDLSIPPKDEMGDYTFWAFVVSKELKGNPQEMAIELVSKLQEIKEFEKVEVAGPFLNLFLSKDLFSDYFAEIYASKNNYWKSDEWKWKTIIIDYIWANVWKPLHIGHMCTPNQGQVMINTYKKLWYTVISDSHIWDWWIIFGKLITAYKIWWDEEKLKENAVNHLFELYVKITNEIEKELKEEKTDLEQQTREAFKLLSEWDKESIALWQKFTAYSIKSAQKDLDRLHIKADFNIGESFYEWLNLPKIENYPNLEYNMSDIVKELLEKKVASPNEDNSVWVEFPNSKISSCMLQKRDGTKWYLASDLACVKYRIKNWNPEKIIYFVDWRQSLHLKQVFETAKLAWWTENTETIHANNWFISLKDWAMSTRKWRIIRLDSLLDEAVSRAKNIILEKRQEISETELDDLANIIWIWAIKYWYLSKNRTTDVVFDWDEFMSFEWNSGPYIQYAYVRARNILAKSEIDYSVKTTYNFIQKEETSLLKTIFAYSSILDETVKWNFPHILAWYAYDLTKKFNSFYNNISVLNEENESIKIARLQLTEMFSIVLKDVFGLLAIEMPEKM